MWLRYVALMKQTPPGSRQRRLTDTWNSHSSLFWCYFLWESQKLHDNMKCCVKYVLIAWLWLVLLLGIAWNFAFLHAVIKIIYFQLFWNLQQILHSVIQPMIITGKGKFTVEYQPPSSWPQPAHGASEATSSHSRQEVLPTQAGEQKASWGWENLTWKNCSSKLQVKEIVCFPYNWWKHWRVQAISKAFAKLHAVMEEPAEGVLYRFSSYKMGPGFLAALLFVDSASKTLGNVRGFVVPMTSCAVERSAIVMLSVGSYLLSFPYCSFFGLYLKSAVYTALCDHSYFCCLCESGHICEWQTWRDTVGTISSMLSLFGIMYEEHIRDKD